MTITFKTIASSGTAAFVIAIASMFSMAHAQPATASTSGGMVEKSSMSGMGGMDMKAMMKDNNDKMASMQMTGDPDADFAMMMKIHHQGAINMAEAELKMGKDAEMKRMAKNIIAAQKKEIAQFDRFAAKHRK